MPTLIDRNRLSNQETAMNRVITVEVRNVYGQDKIYPIGYQASNLARLAGTKTLTIQTLRIAQDMGFEIQEVNPPKIALL